MKCAYTLLVCSLAAIVIGGNAQSQAESNVDEAEAAELLQAKLEEEMEAGEQNLDLAISLSDDEEECARQNLTKAHNLERSTTCCQCGKMNVGLDAIYGDVRGKLPGVTVIQAPTAQKGRYANKPCSKMALLKVNFEKITNETCGDFCLESPYCGRRMLKVDMDLSLDRRAYHLFHVGDSVSNYGMMTGDASHQTNDAEMKGFYSDIYVSFSEKSGTSRKLTNFKGVIGPAVNHLTLYVSNEHIRITNNAGFDEKICHRCLYALNGQTDTGPLNPGPNEDIYIGFNKVINDIVSGRSHNRNGHGMCTASLTWTCPWK